jgi:stage II sporulation protein D
MTPLLLRRILSAAVGTMIAVAVIAAPGPAGAITPQASEIVTVEVVGHEDARFVVDGRRYRGPLIITRHVDGLALTERSSIEQYLEGIAEVPFSWPEESLRAQVVAARTYLVRRLAGGRSADGRQYGFDICATNRCQVYRGVELVEGPSGDRWLRAVRDTESELVTYDGRPIEAVYSAMHGSRSRANQDVWGSDPVPYLQPVDSPEMGRAPFAVWSVELSADQFVEILRADGLDVGGGLRSLVVDDPPEGEGRTTISVATERGTDEILAPALKGTFNRHGDELYPGTLPAPRDGGGRYPEPLLSYTFSIDHEDVEARPIDAVLPDADRVDRDVIRIDGEGWGHGVGMSQWGARIMAEDGASHAEILEHYYSGAVVASVPDLVPDEVVVGLDWERFEIVVDIEGSAELRVNGVPVTDLGGGRWIVRSGRSGIAVLPGDAQGFLPPIGNRPWPR